MELAAILWDYDGTIMNSARKNMMVAREVISQYLPAGARLPYALEDFAAYQEANYKYRTWRELYVKAYGIPEDKLDEAGKLWTPYQLKNQDLPELFPGMKELLLWGARFPMGICSQNSTENIRKTLKVYGVDQCFQGIVGFEEIPIDQPKPNPAEFQVCLEKLGMSNRGGRYLYIGDHGEDVVFGKNAQKFMKDKGIEAEVICICVQFEAFSDIESFQVQPDFVAKSAEELQKVIEKLR